MDLPHPYPSGWYRFRYSHELRARGVVGARFFGKPLVGFRDEAGAAHVLDAHCVHLGAHLADGRVVGDTLRCPFHGWRYDGEGRCRHVPFAGAIPDGARVGSYPVVERNGTIYFWHAVDGSRPWFDVPQVPETEAGRWRRGPVHRHVVRAHILEPRENSIDVAHTPVLHHRSFEVTPGTIPEVRGWNEDPQTEQLRYDLVNLYGSGKRPREAVLSFELAGPGHLVMRCHAPIEMLTLVPNTPVDDERIVFTMLTYIRRSRVPFVDALLVRLAMRKFLHGLHEDYGIFDRKRYLAEPLLSDADGPIPEMRRWLRRFAPGARATSAPADDDAAAHRARPPAQPATGLADLGVDAEH